MNKIIFNPIGIIHSPFKEPGNMPIQPKGGEGIKGSVELFDEYADGLLDIEGFSHIIVLFWFHAFQNVNHRNAAVSVGAQILADIGLHKIRLLTNNPKKIIGLKAYGLEVVERKPIEIAPNLKNVRYLSTKRDKLGHLFGELSDGVRDNEDEDCGCKCNSTAKGDKDGC